MSRHQIVGLMSGTSLDGLDIILAEFERQGDKWSHSILHSTTSNYSNSLREKLAKAKELNSMQIQELDKEFGLDMAKKVNTFIKKFSIDPKSISAIASHGHTVFHQPSRGYSLQIGCGSTLAHHTAIAVINDFRNKDIIAGGQGAPLVPIGDIELFGEMADSFLNLGGFCNITFKKGKKYRAFDIAPCNLPLNLLSNQKGMPYDKGGKLAQKGELSFYLLDLLNRLPYYLKKAPKSLGAEWLEEEFMPLIKLSKPTDDNLRTVLEHIAIQISNVLQQEKIKSVLVTGGGAYNEFLLARIKHHYAVNLIIPNKTIIEFKEALIFAFLGALYLENLPNNVPSVTGARKKVIGGVFHKAN